MRGWAYQDRMDDGIWSCPVWVSRLPQKLKGRRGEKKGKKAKKEERNGENGDLNGEQRAGKGEEEDILSNFEPSPIESLQIIICQFESKWVFGSF